MKMPVRLGSQSTLAHFEAALDSSETEFREQVRPQTVFIRVRAVARQPAIRHNQQSALW